jgi:hypothetical protein
LFGCTSANEADARVCVEGIRLASASQWELSSVIIETDCAYKVKTLQSKEDRSEISFIIEEAQPHRSMPNC